MRTLAVACAGFLVTAFPSRAAEPLATTNSSASGTVPAAAADPQARRQEIQRLQAELPKLRAAALATSPSLLARQAAIARQREAYDARLMTAPELQDLYAKRAEVLAEQKALRDELDELPPRPPAATQAEARARAPEPAEIATRRAHLHEQLARLAEREALANRHIEAAISEFRRTDLSVSQLSAEIIEAQHLLAAEVSSQPEVAAAQARLAALRGEGGGGVSAPPNPGGDGGHSGGKP